MRCQRILIPISPIHLINKAKSQLNHAIPIKGVNVSEETIVAILMALQIKMAQTMNNCPINLNPDHVTISLSHLQKMIVKLILIIRMNLVGLMPSVILRADALTPTHTVSQRLREDSSVMSSLVHLVNLLHLHLRHHPLHLFFNLRQVMPATSRHGKMNHNQVTSVVVSGLFELTPSVSTLLMMMPTFHLKKNNLILMTLQSHPQITSSSHYLPTFSHYLTILSH